MKRKYIPLIYILLAFVTAFFYYCQVDHWNRSANEGKITFPLTIGLSLIVLSLITCTGVIIYMLSKHLHVIAWKTKKTVIFIVALVLVNVATAPFALLIQELSWGLDQSAMMVSLVVSLSYLFKIVLSCAATIIFVIKQL